MNSAMGKTSKKIACKRKVSGGVLVLWTALLLLGIGAGFFAAYFAASGDAFLLNGEKTVSLAADGTVYAYPDPGAAVVEFGMDISQRVRAVSDLEKDADGNYLIDTSEEGIYHIVYTVDSPRFGGVKRVRTIVVGGEG